MCVRVYKSGLDGRVDVELPMVFCTLRVKRKFSSLLTFVRGGFFRGRETDNLVCFSHLGVTF